MNNCLTDITNIVLTKDAVATTLTAVDLNEARAITEGFVSQMGLGLTPIITNATATSRDVRYIGQYNGCCIEISWSETYGACTQVACTLDICAYLGV